MTMLEEWDARFDATNARAVRFGVADRQEVAGMSGLEIFRAIIDGRLPPAPIARVLGFAMIEADVGRVVFQGRPTADYYNPLGAVHGGWGATLLDSCMACAVHSALPAGKSSTTAELKVNYLRPIFDSVGPLRAEGKLIHVGARIGTSEGRLYDTEGKLYAHGTTTCFIFDVA